MVQSLKMSVLALLLGASLAAQAVVHVEFDAQKPWTGFMNWWDMPADGGAFVAQQAWDIADLDAQFSGSTLTLTPNTSTDRYAPSDPYWWKGDGSSNKIMGANLLVIDDSLAGQSTVFSGWVASNTLDGAYGSHVFIRAFNADYSSMLDSVEVPLEHGKAFQVAYQSTASDVHIQYGFDTIGPNARFGNSLGSVVITAVPEPSTWAMMAAGLLGLAALRRTDQRA